MSFSKKDTLVVKGVAIVMLIFHHCFLSPRRFAGYDVGFYPLNQDIVVELSSFFKICVGMFVFLSAYGLTYSLKKYSKDTLVSGPQYASYLNARLIKLMWGFWFVFILCQIASLFFAPQYNMAYFKKGIFQGIFNICVDFLGISWLFNSPMLCGTWWYMTLAIFIVLVVPFIARITKKYNLLFITLVCLFVPRILSAFPFDYNIGGYNNCIKWTFAIILGVFCAQYNVLARMKEFKITKYPFLSKLIKFVLATAVLILFYKMRGNFAKHYSTNTYEISDGLIPAFVVYYIYDFIVDIPIIKQILSFFGKHSMNIFFIHTFIRNNWFMDFTYSFHNWLVIAGVLFGISLVLSIVIEFVKKLIRYDKLMNVIIDRIDKRFCKEV